MVHKCQLLVVGSDLGIGCCFRYAQVDIVVYGEVHDGVKIDGRWKSQLYRFVGVLGMRMGSGGDMLIVQGRRIITGDAGCRWSFIIRDVISH